MDQEGWLSLGDSAARAYVHSRLLGPSVCQTFTHMRKPIFLVGALWGSALLWAQTTVLINSTNEGSFESQTFCGPSGTVEGWNIVNGTQGNRWTVNTAAGGQHGNQAIYITQDCSGNPPPHAYTNSASVVHFWRDITLPSNQPYVELSAWVWLEGEATDFLEIFAIPVSLAPTPTAGSAITNTAYSLGKYSEVSRTGWSKIRAVYYCGQGGQAVRLIFSWKNDAVAEYQPPAAVDAIQVVASADPPGVIRVNSFPYAHGPGTTCGKKNKFDNSNTLACSGKPSYTSPDMLWIIRPDVTGTLTVTCTNFQGGAALWPVLHLYRGGDLDLAPPCGGGLTSSVCLASNVQSTTVQLSACVTAGQVYYLKLEADRDGENACGSFQEFEIRLQAGCVSALPSQESAGISDLELFPNPATEEVQIRFLAVRSERTWVRVLNTLGQVVQEQSLVPLGGSPVVLPLWVGDLPSGPYLIQVEQGSQRLVQVLLRP